LCSFSIFVPLSFAASSEEVIQMATSDPDIVQIVTSMSRYGADEVRRKATRILSLVSVVDKV
jgi:hypothetical protein